MKKKRIPEKAKEEPYTLRDWKGGKPIPPEMLTRIEKIIPHVLELTKDIRPAWVVDRKSFFLYLAKGLKAILEFVKLLYDAPDHPIAAMFWLPQGDYRGLDNLAASELFANGSLFRIERWLVLEPHFIEFRKIRGNLSFKRAWLEIVKPALLLAAGNAEIGRQPFDRVYPFLRKETRKEIERVFMGGRTLDKVTELSPEDVVKREEEDPPAAILLEEKLASELGIFAQVRVEQLLTLRPLLELPALKNLSRKEEEAIVQWLLEEADKVQAQKEGLSEAAIRQRRHRGIKKLKPHLDSTKKVIEAMSKK